MSEQKIETGRSRYPERDGVPWFSESLFSKHAAMAKARKLYFIILAMTSFLIIFVILGKFLSLLLSPALYRGVAGRCPRY